MEKVYCGYFYAVNEHRRGREGMKLGFIVARIGMRSFQWISTNGCDQM